LRLIVLLSPVLFALAHSQFQAHRLVTEKTHRSETACSGNSKVIVTGLQARLGMLAVEMTSLHRAHASEHTVCHY